MIVSSALINLVEFAAGALLSVTASAGIFSTLKSVIPEILKRDTKHFRNAEAEIELKRAELEALEKEVNRLQIKIEILIAQTKANRDVESASSLLPPSSIGNNP